MKSLLWIHHGVFEVISIDTENKNNDTKIEKLWTKYMSVIHFFSVSDRSREFTQVEISFGLKPVIMSGSVGGLGQNEVAFIVW